MERLLAEVMTVSAVAVERIARTAVVPIGAHVGGGHFDQNEMRSRRPPQVGLPNAKIRRQKCPLVHGSSVQTGD